MQIDPAIEYGLWFELASRLAMAATVLVGMAVLANQMARTAVWRRTIWQVTTLGLLALLLLELTGTGPALARLWQPRTGTESIPVAETIARRDAGPRRPTKTGVGSVVSEDFEVVLKRESTSSAASIEANQTLPTTGDTKSTDRRDSFARDPGNRHCPAEIAVGPPQTPDVVSSRNLTADPCRDATTPRRPAGVAEGFVFPGAQIDYGYWAGWMWVLGGIVITGRIMYARVLLWIFRRRHVELLDEALTRRVGILARKLGIRRSVGVVEAAALKAPVAFGTIRPTIGLPAGFGDDFGPSQQDAMLAHELAHLAAGDPVWQLLADLSCATLWWHPLAWWSRRQLRAANEVAADEASLLVPDGPEALADCLVTLGRRLTAGRQLEWLSTQGPRYQSELGRRVERLLSLPKRASRAPGRGHLAMVKAMLPAILVIVAVLCTAWVQPQAILTKGGTPMTLLTTSWHRSLAATALAALIGTVSGGATANDSPTGAPHPAVASDDHPGAIVPDAVQGHDRARTDRAAAEQPEHERHEMEQRARNEREAHFDQLKQKLGELEKNAQHIKRVLGDRGPDQDAESRALHRELDEIDGRIEDIHRELRGDQPGRPPHEMEEHRRRELEEHARDLMRKRRALDEQAQSVERALQQQDDPDSEAAQRLRAELHEIQERADDMEREARPIPRQSPARTGPSPREREEMERHVQELKHEIGHLTEAGHHEEAARLEQEAHDVLQQLQGNFGPPSEERPDDREDRLRHVDAAIEHLHAAGMDEVADRLREQMDDLIEQQRRRLDDRPEDGPRPPARAERPAGPNSVVDELRSQMRDLHCEMDQLRQQVEELLEQKRARR